MRKGVVLIAHGSRRAASNREFEAIVQQVRQRNDLDFDRIESAFLEFSEASLEKAVETMVAAKIERLFVYPYFLNAGNHIVNDIPQKVKTLQQQYHQLTITVLPYIGSSPAMISLIVEDLEGVL